MTPARYRLIHFVPDPFVGSRVPVAAVIEVNGKTSVHRMPHVPGATCLGGRDRVAAVHVLLERLESLQSFERLPMSIGPQAVFDAAHDVPKGVDDPEAWLLQSILAPRPTAKTEGSPRSQQRSTYGWQFFTSWKVQGWVRKTFRPGVDLGTFLAGARALGSVSHYVAGANEVLLMEPLVPSRPTIEADIKHVAQLLGSYGTVTNDDSSRSPRRVAYLLAGGSAATRSRAIDSLAGFADTVVDTTDEHQRNAFLDCVREVGRSTELAAQA